MLFTVTPIARILLSKQITGIRFSAQEMATAHMKEASCMEILAGTEQGIFNRSTGYIILGEVVEFDLSYTDAQLAVEYYCPYAKGSKIKESTSAANKVKREAVQTDKQ